MSHAGFLRDQANIAPADLKTLVRALWDQGARATRLAGEERLRLLSDGVATLPGLSDRERALLLFAARLTALPQSSTRKGVEGLRGAGLDERAAFDVLAIVSLFAFMNRIADGAGVAVQSPAYEWASELLGEDALKAHLAWAQP